jgi:hypothetical protein
MKSLVISSSTVLFEFFKLVLDRDIEGQKSAKDAKDSYYNLIFIDDIVNIKREVEYIKRNIKYDYLILVGSKYEELFDLTLKKPFLPSDLESLINKLFTKDKEKNSPIIEDNSSKESDVKQIKELITKEDSILIEGGRVKLKNRGAKRLLKMFCKLNKKEFKKLFKEAKITIKIEFRSGDE